MKYCHPHNVSSKKTPKSHKMRVTLSFSAEQFEWLQNAANIFTDGCVCDLVGNCFWEEFKRLSEETATAIANKDGNH